MESGVGLELGEMARCREQYGGGAGQEWMEMHGYCGQDTSLEPLQRLFDVMLEECSAWKEEKWGKSVTTKSLSLLVWSTQLWIQICRLLTEGKMIE